MIRALARPGCEMLAAAPYFPEYKPYVEEQRAVFQAVPFKEAFLCSGI